MRSNLTLALALTASAAAGHASAQHADILLAVDPDDNLVAGQIDFDSLAVLNVDTRVYEGEFEGPFSNLWITEDPASMHWRIATPDFLPATPPSQGQPPSPSTPMRSPSNAGTANLWHWNGLGNDVNFAAVAASTVLEISNNFSVPSFPSITLDGSGVGVTGFEIDTTAPSGSLHKHTNFRIYNTDASAPDTGFYLWSLTLHAGAGLQTDPLYFVHGLGIEDEVAHEAAIGYVENNLVPEPGSAILLMLGVTGLLARQRAPSITPPPTLCSGLWVATHSVFTKRSLTQRREGAEENAEDL